MNKVIAIIPARYASSRLPGKPMIEVAGKTIIQRVYEQVAKASKVQEVVVATDDERIQQHVTGFGGKAVMTALTHRNGTERCAEAARKTGEYFDVILNIQGDEPLVSPSQIDILAGLFEEENAQIGTLVKKIEVLEDLLSETEAKVVLNENQEAIYFSRSPIPFLRGVPQEEWIKKHSFYKHLGIYGFRYDILQEVINLPPTLLEKAESLEQLRWLKHYKIKLGITDIDTFAIDTQGDLEKLKKLLS